MPSNGQSRKDAMKDLRQEDMRERIRESNLLTKTLETIDKIDELASNIEGKTEDENGEVIPGNIGETQAKVNALSKANEQRLKLLNKVLPDLRATDMNIQGELKLVAIDLMGIDPEDDDEDGNHD